jgi:hypothetical protein
MIASEREQDGARRRLGEAGGGLAGDAVCAHIGHATLDQGGPHASVDGTRVRAADDQRPKRTGRGCQLRLALADRDDRRLEAELAQCLADAVESPREASRRLKAARTGQRAAEFLACLTERLGSPAPWNPLDEQSDELRQAPVGELDALELGRNAVDVGGTTAARAAPGAPPLGCDREKSGLHKPVEAVTSDVAVEAEGESGVMRSKRIAPGAGVEQNPAKLRIAGRCESVERHRRDGTRRRTTLRRPEVGAREERRRAR